MQLAPIEGTPLHYVVNSATPIIEVDPQSWYACQNGVWYAATSANGPWTVAASVPAVIYTIPPTSPLHYLTYVQVYGSTPDQVYEGYTPGYLGTEVADDGTVVYGTGYDYPPWIGDVWYGPPMTWGWGFDDCWTPWWGWGFDCGFGWGWGFLGGLAGLAVIRRIRGGEVIGAGTIMTETDGETTAVAVWPTPARDIYRHHGQFAGNGFDASGLQRPARAAGRRLRPGLQFADGPARRRAAAGGAARSKLLVWSLAGRDKSRRRFPGRRMVPQRWRFFPWWWRRLPRRWRRFPWRRRGRSWRRRGWRRPQVIPREIPPK